MEINGTPANKKNVPNYTKMNSQPKNEKNIQDASQKQKYNDQNKPIDFRK